MFNFAIFVLLRRLHDILRIFGGNSHDSLDSIGVFVEQMFINHGGNDVFLFEEILHHRVIHLVFLVVKRRVVFHNGLLLVIYYCV